MAEGRLPDLVRRYFHAFQDADRAEMESLLGDGFTFTSPWDDHIGRAAWFERCWPFAGTFRNTELFRFDGDRIRSIDVFFGFVPAGAPPSGGED